MGKSSRDLAYPRLCGLLADRPTRLSAALHNAGFRALGLPFAYVAFDTVDTPGSLRAMRVLGMRGLSLTIPHKEAAVRLVDRLSPDAKEIGSVNTVLNDGGELSGYNTDTLGVAGALRESGFAGDSASVIGAGGAARAAVHALRTLGVRKIFVSNRTNERAEALARDFAVDALPWEELGKSGGVSLVVNATPVGSHLSPPESSQALLARCNLRPGLTVFDMVTSTSTPLTRAAEAAGAAFIPGTRMLLFQALEQFRLFTGQEPPRAEMEAALLQALAV
jgi:shikimate dehydrogenase